MADGFDYLPNVRPHTDDWLWLVIQEMRELRAAGGYRHRVHATRLETGPGIGSGFGADTLANLGETQRFASDHHLRLKPGSIVWGVAAYRSLATNMDDWLNQQVWPWLEVELIDGQTNESWWRTSLNAGAIPTEPYDDPLWYNPRNNFQQRDTYEMQAGLLYIPGGHEVLGDGLVMARFTMNAQPQLTNLITAPALPSKTAAQLALHVMEPMTEGA